METKELGEFSGKQVLLVVLENYSSLPKECQLPGPYFQTIFFVDEAEVEIETGDRFDFLINDLLDRGSCYFVCGGTGGSHLENWISETVIFREIEDGITQPDDGAIMTSWENKDPLSEVVNFALQQAKGDDHYIPYNPAKIFFMLKDSPYLNELEGLLSDLGSFRNC